MSITTSPTLRKAALLVRSLDADSAAVLLAQLSADEAKAVRRAMSELREVDPTEQEELRDALRPAPLTDESNDESLGVELAFSAEVADESLIASTLPASTPSHSTGQPFSWLEGGDLPSLATMLEREHLSTVAVVLSHLPPDSASKVLSALPAGRRAAALERLADLGESDRASLEVIEGELADWIAAQKAERQRRADRLQSIQAILRHSSPSTCDSVLAEIATHDAALAKEIGRVRSVNSGPSAPAPARAIASQAAALRKPKPVPKPTPRPTPTPNTTQPTPASPAAPPTFPFDRLAELNDRQLAELFRNCAGDRVVLALAGASERVFQHVARRLPKDVVKELQRRMHALSSVRLSDFVVAQDEVARTAARLFGPVRS